MKHITLENICGAIVIIGLLCAESLVNYLTGVVL